MVRLTLDTDFEFQKNFVLAVFYTGVAMVLEAMMRTFTPSLLAILPSIYQSGITYIIAFFVVFAIFTVINMKRPPYGLNVHLFFPKDTKQGDKTFDYHQKHDFHRVVINLKTSPYAAYDLKLGSYAWKLLEKAEKAHRRIWVEEIDTAPNDPNFLQKWCKERNYLLFSNIPDRKELLWNSILSKHKPLDPRLEHVNYRAWYPFYRYGRPKGLPQKRIALNYSTKKAYPFPIELWNLAYDGEILGHLEIAPPIPRHAQRWAKKRGFEWTDKIATMNDLLMKKEDEKDS